LLSSAGSIEAISIVGRFLEHGRIYISHNGGDERYFIVPPT
jgi:polyphosphate kinase